jgi:phosphoserine phosphatase
VLSSTPKLNLKGLRKLSAIQEYCRLHDIVSFGYVGDSAADLPIWQAADELFIVAPRRALLGRIRKLNRAYVVLGSRSAPASETA